MGGTPRRRSWLGLGPAGSSPSRFILGARGQRNVSSRGSSSTRSRIVARLTDGVVTTPRAEADVVVTEYGIAELRGRTLAERAQALIAVADPSFRSELVKASERPL